LFAIGHFAIGYLVGKATARGLHVQLNMPLLLAASIIPDVDLLLRFVAHRGPTHSLFAIIALTAPFLIMYRKAALPYFVALLSHSLIGDFFTGGTQLFWPLSREWVGALDISVMSMTNVLLELGLFFVAIAVMLRMGDLRKIVKDKYRIALVLPFGAVLGPLLGIGRGIEYGIPLLLVIPSLFFLAIFVYSFVVDIFRKR
jgi:membrane-bound metal-dependent hydrolase YbcI (DUF457 family)